MGQNARVTSIQALEEFRAAVVRFQAEAAEALSSVEMEIRRAIEELQERGKNWRRAEEKCQQAVAQAKIELNRKKIERVFGRQPDCTEQEKNLRKAQARLEHAEARIQACRRWGPKLERSIMEYEGPARQMASFLENELVKAIVFLEKRTEALDAYARLAPPSVGGRGAAPPETGIVETRSEAKP